MCLVCYFLGCIECMRCRLLLPMCAVSVHQSVGLPVCHARSFGAAVAKLLWSLVNVIAYCLHGPHRYRINKSVLCCGYVLLIRPILRSFHHVGMIIITTQKLLLSNSCSVFHDLFARLLQVTTQCFVAFICNMFSRYCWC